MPSLCVDIGSLSSCFSFLCCTSISFLIFVSHPLIFYKLTPSNPMRTHKTHISLTNNPISPIHHTRGQHHGSVLHSSTDIIKDEAGHQHELQNLRRDHERTREVLAEEAPASVQLLPTAHPEEEVQELGGSHREDEVRRVRLDHAVLRVTPARHSPRGSSGTCTAAGRWRRPPGTWRWPTAGRSRSRRGADGR